MNKVQRKRCMPFKWKSRLYEKENDAFFFVLLLRGFKHVDDTFITVLGSKIAKFASYLLGTNSRYD